MFIIFFSLTGRTKLHWLSSSRRAFLTFFIVNIFKVRFLNFLVTSISLNFVKVNVFVDILIVKFKLTLNKLMMIIIIITIMIIIIIGVN